MTKLYRHFDKEGRLLYVGISLSVMQRLASHRQYAAWFKHLASTTYEDYPTRKEALAAEKLAIKAEKPLYNIAHNEVPIIERKCYKTLEIFPDSGNYYTLVLPDKDSSEVYVIAETEEEAISLLKDMLASGNLDYWDAFMDMLVEICSEEGLLKRYKGVSVKSHIITKAQVGFKDLETFKKPTGIRDYFQQFVFPVSLLDLVKTKSK